MPIDAKMSPTPLVDSSAIAANQTVAAASMSTTPVLGNDFSSSTTTALPPNNEPAAPLVINDLSADNFSSVSTTVAGEIASPDTNIIGGNSSVDLNKIDKPQSIGKKNATASPMPLSIMAILFLAVFVLIGLGVFALWYHQYRQINGLNAHLKSVIEDRNQLNEQLEQARQNLVLSEKKPVFLEESGAFSFYQDIPNLVVQKTDQGALLHFGEIMGEKAVNGFVMKIAGQQTNGKSLDEIVSSEMAQKVVGATRTDKQDEGTKCYQSDNKEQCYISDKIGFSYVERGNDYWKVIYFLRNDPHATYYLRIEFAPAGSTPASQDEYGRIGGQILSSIKIYRDN